MHYLQNTPLRSHGSLTSLNCLIDSRWVLKVSGFGLSHFTMGSAADNLPEYKKYFHLLWTAPELLRLADKDRPTYGTRKADVYSFAIILQEVIYRTKPFFDKLPPKGEKRTFYRFYRLYVSYLRNLFPFVCAICRYLYVCALLCVNMCVCVCVCACVCVHEGINQGNNARTRTRNIDPLYPTNISSIIYLKHSTKIYIAMARIQQNTYSILMYTHNYLQKS